ncbi:MAG: 5-(carboxyamino)imidazole ribonucleotide mutase [Firmicutes bacterium HGW-Firmicutes-11]|nr:MAG: 5-(carboxyamino)imidazole ribonucleotide mutase [Firmicutes bacterium HGW-Firmicutes-11]
MLVGIIMGSDSDYDVMADVARVLKELEIMHEIRIVSAHRTPDKMFEYARTARDRGVSVIVAGAGGSAHLPGMVASLTCLPVIGVPVKTKNMDGLDSLLSIVQMPAGVPVATVPVNGGMNAGLLAARILAIENASLQSRLDEYMTKTMDGQSIQIWIESQT